MFNHYYDEQADTIDQLETRIRLLESALKAVAELLKINKSTENVDSAIAFIERSLNQQEQGQ
jgi:hypothetical protein